MRLTSAVSVLSTLDPVRLHQDFASLDHLSQGRTEIIAGRSAFLEAFTLFGIDPAHYDDIFAEKLDLLLAIRAAEHVTWSGRHRPALDDMPVPPRPQQDTLPLWLGVGGTPSSAERGSGTPAHHGPPKQNRPRTDGILQRVVPSTGHCCLRSTTPLPPTTTDHRPFSRSGARVRRALTPPARLSRPRHAGLRRPGASVNRGWSIGTFRPFGALSGMSFR
ncbi:LLM class flavin-dependent oxidoreductase [Streptomyces sp. A475]|uniref:LLM class flavin-dependent oxidoreductase n=1 Tax=Streptomyces sp. A475 TaxID=3131976 RepID=UPI00404091C2